MDGWMDGRLGGWVNEPTDVVLDMERRITISLFKKAFITGLMFEMF